MFATYKSKAHVYVMYISEAHPTDGRQSQSNVKEGILIKQPTSQAERDEVAREFASQFKVSLPILVDTIDNKVDKAYSAKPDRIYVIDGEGKIAYKGGPGPRGFNVADVPAVLDRLLGVKLAGKAGVKKQPGGSPFGSFRSRDPIQTALDTNKDGEIDGKEITDAEAALKKLDKNKDGKLSREELRPAFGQFRPAGGNPGNIVERLRRLDKNNDGKLSKQEVKAGFPGPFADRIFQRADGNNDGVIDAAELKQMNERFRGRQPGQRPGASGQFRREGLQRKLIR